MRRARSISLWLSAFLLGTAVPAFCQVIVPPNISGRAIPTDIGTASFQAPVYSTGAFDASLLVFRNGQLKFFGSGTVCTSGPLTTVSFSVPFGQFGLTAGDAVTFALAIHHQGTEGNTTSVALSIIPVVTGSAPPPPPPPPPPPTSKASPAPDGAWARADARKEEPAL